MAENANAAWGSGCDFPAGPERFRRARDIIGRAVQEGRDLLSELEAKRVFAAAGIPTVVTHSAFSPNEAASLADQIGYPVGIKILSPDITHKSDVGGVILGLNNALEVVEAYEQMFHDVEERCPGARIEGATVQAMADPGVEVVVGMTRDPQFGPVLMFGLGGVLVEVLKDVSFRVVPLCRADAREMIQEIKGFPLLNGYRGREPVDIRSLEDILLNLSDLCSTSPELKEVDLNPIFACAAGAVAVDARVILDGHN